VASLRKKFERHLRLIRAQRRMTQEQFAEVLEMSVDLLSLMERGVSVASFETLERMATRLRLSSLNCLRSTELQDAAIRPA
jgi:transcriptional regulator with XRE-family HTH domain